MIANLRIQVLAFALLALVSCGSLIYTISARQAAVEDNTYLTNCLSELVKESGTSTSQRSKAAAKRDDALQRVVDLRVSERRPNGDPEVAAAVAEFDRASEEMRRIREINPIPSFAEYCKTKVHR